MPSLDYVHINMLIWILMTVIGPNSALSFQQQLIERLRTSRTEEPAKKEEPRAPQDELTLSPNGELTMQQIIAQSGVTPPPQTIEEVLKRHQAQEPKKIEQKPPGDATELTNAVAPVPDIRLGTDTYNTHTGKQIDIRV